MKEGQHLSKRPRWLLWILMGLLVSAGAAIGFWQIQKPGLVAAQAVGGQQTAVGSPKASAAYPTTTVRRGNLSLNASGGGNLIAAQTINLGFATSGKIATLNVQQGDHVKSGQVLAELSGIEQLKVNIQNQQLAVQVAQKALDDLQANAAGQMAQALATQASSQAAVATAEAGVHYQGDPRCDPSKTETYYYQWLYAQKVVDYWQGLLDNPNTGYGKQYIQQNLNPAVRIRDLALYNYTYCQGYTPQEIQASQASLQKAQVDAQQAQNTYKTLQQNQGIDPNTLQLDQAQLQNAEAQLVNAQQQLTGATLVAPLDGVVTAVNGAAGLPAGKGSIITIADINHPQVQVNIDETDLGSFAAGCSAQVTFNALAGKVFAGTVTQVAPTLVTVNNAPEAQGVITLNTLPAGGSLPLGADATVNVSCKGVQNALLVPVQALVQRTGQPPYVYVLNAQGQPEKRTVEIGLQTSASIEIRSGLNEGERVITNPNLVPSTAR